MKEKVKRIDELLTLLKSYHRMMDRTKDFREKVEHHRGHNGKLATIKLNATIDNHGYIDPDCFPSYADMSLVIPETGELTVTFCNSVIEALKPKIEAVEKELDILIRENDVQKR